MHSAPSVNYPVGRSAFAGRAGAVLVLAGLAACGAWSWQADPGWRQFAGFAAVLACGAFAVHAWWRSPLGVLRWDGLAWTWEEGGGQAGAGQPELALDLQGRLLLHWRPHQGRSRWLWLERASDASHWDALRRAVYSRASTQVPAAGKPPAAEQ
jgi:toxin CptA